MRLPSIAFFLIPFLLAATATVAADEHPHHGGGHHAAAERDEFYWKVGKFAVWIYCLHTGISPVLELELVVSASTRPARNGHGVEYLMVLRVARLGTCEALVWGVPGEGSHDWKLKDFKQLNGT